MGTAPVEKLTSNLGPDIERFLDPHSATVPTPVLFSTPLRSQVREHVKMRVSVGVLSRLRVRLCERMRVSIGVLTRLRVRLCERMRVSVRVRVTVKVKARERVAPRCLGCKYIWH